MRITLSPMTDFDGRRWHDMGGKAAGPLCRDEHDYALWEKRVDALLVLSGKKGLMSVENPTNTSVFKSRIKAAVSSKEVMQVAFVCSE